MNIFRIYSQSCGQLAAAEKFLSHTNVSSDVSHCFDKAYDLIAVITEGYAILAAMQLLDIDHMNAELENNSSVSTLLEKKKQVVDEVFCVPNISDILNAKTEDSIAKAIHQGLITDYTRGVRFSTGVVAAPSHSSQYFQTAE